MTSRSVPARGAPVSITRRDFVSAGVGAVGGLLLGVRLSPERDAAAPAAGARAADMPLAPNAYVQIDPDDRVTVITPRPEMGQGSRTALAMLVAEELDADWATVRVQQGDLDEEVYGEQYAGGSAVVRTSYGPLRAAGAAARAMLIAAAAERWNTSAAGCRSESGAVIHDATGRRLRYGELVARARTLPVPADVPLKDPKHHRIIGRPTPGVDVPDIVIGRATFGVDVRVRGMLVASVERCPVFGGRVVSVDDAAARAVPGVRDVIVIDPDVWPEFEENSPKPAAGVAVVANSTWTAMRARTLLEVRWDARGGERESTSEMRDRARARASHPPDVVRRTDGDATRALASASRRLEAVYEVPLLAHATMEPMSCTAHVAGRRCELWAPTQNPAGARKVAARVAGIDPEGVRVHLIRMGGGFGRRFYADFVAEAVALSKTVKRPVQVAWTREDDMRHGFYRPAGYHVMRAGLDAAGRPVAWTQHLINAPRGRFLRWSMNGKLDSGAGELEPYDVPAGFIPNVTLAYSALDSRIPRGQWRAVESSATVFVTQSFLAELAHAAGRDLLEYQLELLGPAHDVKYYDTTYDTGRLANVLRLAAERGQWGKPVPAGWGRGIAASYANSAYVAHVVDVEVSSGGDVRVRRVTSAVDCGVVVNPLGATAQVEGSVIFGLSAALKQQVTVQGGSVVQRSFTDYPPLHIHESPEMDVIFVKSTGPVLGIGEGALPPIAPALTNAIFAATGVRVRSLPVGSVSRQAPAEIG